LKIAALVIALSMTLTPLLLNGADAITAY